MAKHAQILVQEADEHGLDYRLMPALAYVESSGGKFAHGNNTMGWANGKTSYSSPRAAIHTVAVGLSEGRSYRGKTLSAKMRAFNTVNRSYYDRVRSLMQWIESYDVE